MTKYKLKVLMLFYVFLINFDLQSAKVALCVMATGKYLSYAHTMIESATKYFCVNHDVTYLIFTDDNSVFDGTKKSDSSIKYIYQKRLGWPYDTMNRFHVYYAQKDFLETMDYVFATDADMLFVDFVGKDFSGNGEEIFNERVATQHPGYVGQRGTYETNNISTACIRSNEGKYYFAGGFYGGRSPEFLKLVKTCADNVDKDLKKNFIAIWHDESHLNRYFIDNKPTRILSPSYCYPERWNLPYHKRLLALDKNHADLRS